MMMQFALLATGNAPVYIGRIAEEMAVENVVLSYSA